MAAKEKKAVLPRKKYNLTGKQVRALNRHESNLRMTWEGATFEREESEQEFLCDRAQMWGDPANADVYKPSKTQRVPEGGAWAMITRQLPGIEGNIQERVRVGRIFYLEHEKNADKFGFLPDGSYKVLSNTPWGTVHLWPYEYSVMTFEEVLACWQGGEMEFHPMNVELGRMNDIVHYARSRGYGLADALVIALGTIKGPVGWFEPLPELAEQMEAMEERVHRWNPERKTRMEVDIKVSDGTEEGAVVSERLVWEERGSGGDRGGDAEEVPDRQPEADPPPAPQDPGAGSPDPGSEVGH